jgi:HK97 gp10 family phage protein
MAETVKFEGFKDIEKILDALPKALGPKVVRESLRKGVKPYIMQARSNAPKDKGDLGKSIGVINSKNKDRSGIIVGPRRGKGKTSDGWHAHLVEYGVSPRIVKKPTKKHYQKGTVLGAMPDKPFLRPAWDATNGLVRAGIARSLREVLDSNFKGVFK